MTTRETTEATPMRSLTIVLHERALDHLESFRRLSEEIAGLRADSMSRDSFAARMRELRGLRDEAAFKLALAVDWAARKE